MTTLTQLREEVRELTKTHPDLKSEILGYYELCMDEISEGGSETHEVNLCSRSIQELLEEKGL